MWSPCGRTTIYQFTSALTDGKLASSDCEDPFLLFEFPDSNSDSDTDSDIGSVHNPEKVGVMKSTLAISASTSVSVCKRFPARMFHSQTFKSSPQQPRQIVTKEITIHAWRDTIPKLIIYFTHHRFMKMVVNFRNQFTFGMVTKFVAKTHL